MLQKYLRKNGKFWKAEKLLFICREISEIQEIRNEGKTNETHTEVEKKFK